MNKATLIEKTKINTLKSKIEELYRKMNSDINWKNTFKEIFEREKIVDFSSFDFIPKSLNQIGCYIMKSEKFWVMWIEIIKNELKLESLVKLTNNALTLVSDSKLILTTFNRTINFLKIPTKVIKDYVKSEGIKVPANSTIGDYAYLLNITNNRNIKIINMPSKIQKTGPMINNINLNMKKNLEKEKIPISAKEKTENFLAKDNQNADSIYNTINNQSDRKLKSKLDFNNFNDYLLSSVNNIKPDSAQTFQTFSIYELINDSENSQSKQIDFHNSSFKIEPSNMTISETANEETLNEKINLMGLNRTNFTAHCEQDNDKENSKNDNPKLLNNIVTPTKADKEKSGLIDLSRYEENLKNNCADVIDTKSIVDEIEKITTTLKKEIEQLKSPEFCNPSKLNMEQCVDKCCNFKNENKQGCQYVENNYQEIIEEISYSNMHSVLNENKNEVNKEDSYERHLKELATKRGEDVSEYIRYSNYKPEFNDIFVSPISPDGERKFYKSVCDESNDLSKSNDQEFRRKSKRKSKKNKSKSKSKSKSTSKSKSKSKNSKNKTKK